MFLNNRILKQACLLGEISMHSNKSFDKERSPGSLQLLSLKNGLGSAGARCDPDVLGGGGKSFRFLNYQDQPNLSPKAAPFAQEPHRGARTGGIPASEWRRKCFPVCSAPGAVPGNDVRHHPASREQRMTHYDSPRHGKSPAASSRALQNLLRFWSVRKNYFVVKLQVE